MNLSKTFILNLFFIFFFLSISNAEIIKKILPKGNERISAESIIMFAGVNINDDLNNDNLNNILKKLYKTNFFKSVDIQLINSVLVINVIEYPIIQNLTINGVKSKPLKKLISDRISLKRSSSYSKYFVEKDLLVIENILQEVGFYLFNIDTLVTENENNSIDLSYNINLGDKSYIDEILFLGNKKFKSGNLLNIIASEENKFWKILSKKKFLNKQRIELDKRLLLSYYRNKGYYKARIESDTVNRTNNKNFQLIFNIDSGNKFFFNDFIINLPDDYDSIFFDKIKNRLNKLKLSPYSFKVIEKILKEIETIALNEDYEFVDATIDEKIIEKNKINVVINLTQSSKFYVRKINILGNNITIEDVIRNQLIVDEGDPLNNILLKKSINNIQSLNIFKSVVPSIEDTEINFEKVINIEVVEKPTGEISAGAGAGTSGVSTVFGVKENNFLGKGIKLDSNLLISSEGVRGLFSFINPNYKNTDKDLILSIESSETDRIKDFGYRSSLHGLSVGTRFEYRDDFFITPTISSYYEGLKTSSTASNSLKKQEGDYFDTILSYVLDLDRRDQLYQPRDGFRSRFSQEIPVLSDNPSIINGYEINSYYEYLSDVVASASFYVSSANSIGNKDVKISDRLYLPSKKLRGFEPGKVGPVDNGDFVGGNYITAINLSSDLPIFKSFEKTNFIMFFDIGNVWGVDYSSSISNSNKVRSAVGVGLDFFTPIGPLNFTLSQPISKMKTDKTETFRFNLGTTF